MAMFGMGMFAMGMLAIWPPIIPGGQAARLAIMLAGIMPTLAGMPIGNPHIGSAPAA